MEYPTLIQILFNLNFGRDKEETDVAKRQHRRLFLNQCCQPQRNRLASCTAVAFLMLSNIALASGDDLLSGSDADDTAAISVTAAATPLDPAARKSRWWNVSPDELRLPAEAVHMSAFDRDVEKAILLHRVEPSRIGIAAENWRSPYCVRWTDGCTRCERTDVRDDPQCRSVRPQEGVRTCPKLIQRYVECEKADMSVLAELCLTYKVADQTTKTLQTCGSDKDCEKQELTEPPGDVPDEQLLGRLYLWPPNGQSVASFWRDSIVKPELYTKGSSISCTETKTEESEVPRSTGKTLSLDPYKFKPWISGVRDGKMTAVFLTDAYFAFNYKNLSIQRELLLHRIEPDRFVRAADWRSPYCLSWNDGFNSCERRTLSSNPTCKPVADDGQLIRPSFVRCNKINEPKLNAICYRYDWFNPSDSKIYTRSQHSDSLIGPIKIEKNDRTNNENDRSYFWPVSTQELLSRSREINLGLT